MCIILLALALSLATPLAATAETFDFDVLRALNNPLVMQKAQKHFGQQLLNHIILLEWGFRLGGTVITVKMVRDIITAMCLAMVTTVSQAFFAQANFVS